MCDSEAGAEEELQRLLGNVDQLYLADPSCDCRHCYAYRKDPEAVGYWTMFKTGDMGHTLRKGLMPCGKVAVPEFDVPEAPKDSGLRRVEMYPAGCCGVEVNESRNPVCEWCG